MRGYVHNPDRDQTGKRALYRNRTSLEWDLGLRLFSEDWNREASDIIQQLEINTSRLHYALVGGIEETAKAGRHVHIALIFKNHVSKHAVLHMLNRVDIPNQYCNPRNQRYSYIGWKCHHTKIDTKLGPERQLYEYGQLPQEALTLAQWKTCKKFDYEGPKPTIQQKIKFNPSPKPSKVKEPKEPKQRATTYNKEHTELRINGTRHRNPAKRTEEACIKAATRLIRYQTDLSIETDPTIQEKLRTIIIKINQDYFD
jgi:hypothetical protein